MPGEKLSYRFRKEEKLRHKRLVDGVFEKGITLYDYPLRATFRALDSTALDGSFRNGTPQGIGDMQLLITVPKKKLRHAVDRVRMRRLIREAYRLNRLSLKEKIKQSERIRTLSIAIIYLCNEKTDFTDIDKKVKNLLEKISLNIEL